MAGYLGNIPTAVPLTSADIADGIITSAKIADGTIVNADINASAGIVGTKLGAGALLQVVYATDSTNRSTTSTSFVTASNTLSVSITPSSASNKIWIHCDFGTENVINYGYATLFRDATNIGDSSFGFMIIDLSNAQQSFSVLDSPSTTSAITYQVYIRSNSSTTSINNQGNVGTITAFEIKG